MVERVGTANILAEIVVEFLFESRIVLIRFEGIIQLI